MKFKEKWQILKVVDVSRWGHKVKLNDLVLFSPERIKLLNSDHTAPGFGNIYCVNYSADMLAIPTSYETQAFKYEHFPKPIKDIVRKECQLQIVEYDPSAYDMPLKFTFTWSKSTQGLKFWKKVLQERDIDYFYNFSPTEVEEKTEFDNIPVQLQELIKLRIKEQGNSFNKKLYGGDRLEGGFTWKNTVEGHSFWSRIITDKNYNYFEDGRLPGEKLVRGPRSYAKAGEKFVMVDTSHDKVKFREVITLDSNDQSTAPQFTYKNITFFCLWHKLVPLNEIHLIKTLNTNRNECKETTELFGKLATITTGSTPRGSAMYSPRAQIILGN